MHMFFEFLLQGIVGFVIGAGTNDLAIRWVFWALFAKKKKEIAEAVQKVISRELMSPDKIASRLASPEVAENLRSAVLSALQEAAARPWPSLDTLAKDYAGLRLGTLQSQLATLASGAVADRLSEPSFRADVLRPFLDEQWQRLAPRRPAELLPAPTRDLLAGLPDRLADAVLFPEHRERLCAVIAGGLRSWMTGHPTPASFLGPANTAELAALAGSRTRLLGEELAGLLATPPAQEALCAAIRTAVQTRLNGQGAIGTLLSGLSGAAIVETQLAKFCETLPPTVRIQFARAGDAERMRGLVETAVRKLLGRTWAELLDTDTPDGIERHVRALLASDAVRDMTRHGFASVTASVLDSLQAGTLADASTLLTADGDISAYLDWLAETLHNALRSADVRPQIAEQTEEAIQQLCARPIGSPSRFLPEGAQSRLAALLVDQLTGFACANITDLAERTRFWDIISESITVYDDKKMEQIARSVANRELLWVTALGGVIGFTVGIAQGVLLLIMR
ncbi:MAG: DUF445 family protein [Kiritimatiellae bacterium]|nr:DUF445 family protein [Kiritimatiellia bacterium]